MVEGNILT